MYVEEKQSVSNRISFNDLNDVISPKEMGQYLGIHLNAAYQLSKQQGFPSLRVGKKILIPKQGLAKWLESQTQNT